MTVRYFVLLCVTLFLCALIALVDFPTRAPEFLPAVPPCSKTYVMHCIYAPWTA
jgi:hypothetical protein